MGYSQNSLTSCIYEMALGRSGWEAILDILSASFPGALVLVSGDDLATRSNIVFAHRGLKPDAAAAYRSTFAPLNPWLEGQAALAPAQVYHDDQLLPRESALRSPYWTRWLAPAGDFAAGTGVVLLRQGTRHLVLEIRYRADDVETRERAAQTLGEAAQHFGRAFEIAARSRFSAGHGYLDHVVEDLPFGIFFVDRELRIHYANQAAEALRQRQGGPFSSVDSVLRATDVEADGELRRLVDRTLGTRRSRSTVLQLKSAEGEARYFAIGRPALRDGHQNQLHDAVLDAGPLAMLVVHGSLELAALPMDLLWRSFALTESEARLAEALLGGATLADFAKEREVSKQTLRNQLVGVMRKTGTRRQAELVSLLTRLALACL